MINADQVTDHSKVIRAIAALQKERRRAKREELSNQFAARRQRNVLPAFEFLYDTHCPNGKHARFKVPKGGRGKGASWGIADRLLEKAATEKSLILCTREIQNSIADSVHRLLKARITELGYSQFFNITQTHIKSLTNGSEFIFRGLNDLTVETVRSMEGVTDVWVAEAERLGKYSWLVLEPTIRTEGSTLYVDYNPDDEESPTNLKFTRDCPDDAIVRHLTFADNPHFPQVLENLRLQAFKRIEDAENDEQREQATLDYNHVWLGHTRKISKASILGAYYTVQNFTPKVDEGKWDGPYDGCDWGFSNDPTVRVRVWIWEKTNGKKYLAVEREVYLLDHNGMALELRHLPQRFDEFPDSRTVLIRADNARPENIRFMANEGFKIKAADKWKGSVEDGIDHIRGVYHGIIVHGRCPRAAEECKLYSYKLHPKTHEVLNDIASGFDHVIDSIRYALDPLIKRKKGGLASDFSRV